MQLTMGLTNLLDLLERAAASPKGTGIAAYSPGNVKGPATRLSYNDLLQLALANAPMLHHIPGVTEDTIFLLHFDNHLDGFEWLWSVIAAVSAFSKQLFNQCMPYLSPKPYLESKILIMLPQT